MAFFGIIQDELAGANRDEQMSKGLVWPFSLLNGQSKGSPTGWGLFALGEHFTGCLRVTMGCPP